MEKILSAVEDSSSVQTLLFSATMPHWVKDLTRKFLKPNYKMVDLIGDDKIKAATTVGGAGASALCAAACGAGAVQAALHLNWPLAPLRLAVPRCC